MIGIKRKTRYENRYHPNMGRLKCRVTRIYKTLFGIPIKEIYAYRETYYGEVKDLDECIIEK
jgi:hypothetical protein